jgi:hypothetical protein
MYAYCAVTAIGLSDELVDQINENMPLFLIGISSETR